jgi:hypothetical protein
MITDYPELLANVFGGFVGSILVSAYTGIFIETNAASFFFWHTVLVLCKDFSQVLLIEKSQSINASFYP